MAGTSWLRVTRVVGLCSSVDVIPRAYGQGGLELESISMTKRWSTLLGPDLHVDLDRGDLRRSLETVLRDAVRAGRLPAGTRLPSTRTLAADLGVARGTVTHAYEQLVAEGYLISRQGSGTRAAALISPATAGEARASQDDLGGPADQGSPAEQGGPAEQGSPADLGSPAD